ncbi:uncharacterized protein LOC101854814 [Aplysia californica]|uniref:Uncharacterized protein LOC101854814 n=1 Tax=Aplysia californica TaxID=6500 RepID=A0ABM0JZ62_APLCA|nr:uncharacterized protein LOC101854814 [Aplysia californica]
MTLELMRAFTYTKCLRNTPSVLKSRAWGVFLVRLEAKLLNLHEVFIDCYASPWDVGLPSKPLGKWSVNLRISSARNYNPVVTFKYQLLSSLIMAAAKGRGKKAAGDSGAAAKAAKKPAKKATAKKGKKTGGVKKAKAKAAAKGKGKKAAAKK